MNDAWSGLAASLPELASRRPRIEGDDPVLPTGLRVGAAASAAIGAAAVAAAALLEQRGGPAQQVALDLRQAAAALTSFLWLKLEGGPCPAPQGELPSMAIYRCTDGRWIHLHGALPHLRDGTLALLGCEDRAASIAAAPLVELRRIGAAPPRGLTPASRPLAGLRVLDLTRILAGPTCARTLAEHGAEVLRLSSPRQQDIPSFVPDTSHGKHSAWLDLDAHGSDAQLRRLVAVADVFLQGYRSGALEARGFGAEALARLRPGIVCVSINAYGHDGPWSARRGWEQLAQACTGVALQHCGCAPDSAEAPAVIPAAPSDYCSGYLAACGAMLALQRQARAGGSWEVCVSLARTAMWLRELGTVPADARPAPLAAAEIDAWSQTRETPWGRLTYLGPVARMSATPPRWARPSVPPGHDAPAWP